LHLECPQSFLADVFILGHYNNADLGAFLVGKIVQKGLWRSHRESAATAVQVLEVLIFPGDDIDDSRDGACPRCVDAFDARVRIGAPEKLGVEHVWNNIIDTEFRNTCSLSKG
jgi:hypothetical protein